MRKFIKKNDKRSGGNRTGNDPNTFKWMRSNAAEAICSL